MVLGPDELLIDFHIPLEGVMIDMTAFRGMKRIFPFSLRQVDHDVSWLYATMIAVDGT